MNDDDLLEQITLKAFDLLQREPLLTNDDDRYDWVDEVLLLLEQVPIQNKIESDIESNHDYQFLRSIIDNNVDLFSNDIARQLKMIISDGNMELQSLFKPAVSVLSSALFARSQQFLNMGTE